MRPAKPLLWVLLLWALIGGLVTFHLLPGIAWLASGLFCLVLLFHGILVLVAPATLIFYGLALINASKYTFNDIRYLGLCEVILGLLASYFIGYGLLFWATGFGALHIIYGAMMYNKYER